MARTTILDAIVHVLSKDATPRSAKEIHDRIVAQSLYVFGAKDPVGMVRASIRKHLRSHGGPGQPTARVARAGTDTFTTTRA